MSGSTLLCRFLSTEEIFFFQGPKMSSIDFMALRKNFKKRQLRIMKELKNFQQTSVSFRMSSSNFMNFLQELLKIMSMSSLLNFRPLSQSLAEPMTKISTFRSLSPARKRKFQIKLALKKKVFKSCCLICSLM